MSIYRALHSSMHVNYRKTQPIYNDTEIQISLDFPEALYIKAHLLCDIIMHISLMIASQPPINV